MSNERKNAYLGYPLDIYYEVGESEETTFEGFKQSVMGDTLNVPLAAEVNVVDKYGAKGEDFRPNIQVYYFMPRKMAAFGVQYTGPFDYDEAVAWLRDEFPQAIIASIGEVNFD